jgi:hypothetical protein
MYICILYATLEVVNVKISEFIGILIAFDTISLKVNDIQKFIHCTYLLYNICKYK